MWYIRARYLLIYLMLGLGLLFHWLMGLPHAWYFYAGGGVLLIMQLFFGGIWIAYSLLKRGQPDEAARVLEKVWKPGWLIRRNRAYYYFILGIIHLQHKKLDQARAQLHQALALKLDRPNDHALAALNLAHLYYVQQQPDEALRYLEESRAANPTDLLIKDNLNKLEQALTQMRQARRPPSKGEKN